MPGPPPAVAATRVAARAAYDALPPGALVLVACSGGPDSLALAAAAAFECRRAGHPTGAVVVDHGLQEGSAEVAESAAAGCRLLGLDPVEVVRIDPIAADVPGGPQARARQGRYDALAAAADRLGAAEVWLGHTLDDQAEQVLLGLARGSGTRTLAGIPATRPPYRRPFLALPREVTHEACLAQGLHPWRDPSNDDPGYARARARSALVRLETELGPGFARALARSADLARDDADLLDAYAEEAYAALGSPPWPVAALADHPRALRGRLWRLLAGAGGCPGALSYHHVCALDALVTAWRGQGPVALPGGWRGVREAGTVRIVGPGRVE